MMKEYSQRKDKIYADDLLQAALKSDVRKNIMYLYSDGTPDLKIRVGKLIETEWMVKSIEETYAYFSGSKEDIYYAHKRVFEYLKYYPFLQTILPAEKFSALETALKKTFIQVGSYITSNYTDKDTQVKLGGDGKFKDMLLSKGNRNIYPLCQYIFGNTYSANTQMMATLQKLYTGENFVEWMSKFCVATAIRGDGTIRGREYFDLRKNGLGGDEKNLQYIAQTITKDILIHQRPLSSKDKLDFFQDRKNYQQLLGNDLFDEALLYIADQPIKNDNQSIAKKFIEWYDQGHFLGIDNIGSICASIIINEIGVLVSDNVQYFSIPVDLINLVYKRDGTCRFDDETMKSIDYAARQKTDKKFEDQAELFPYQELVYKFGLIHTFQISKYIYDNNPKIKLTSGKTIDIKDNVTFIAGVIGRFVKTYTTETPVDTDKINECIKSLTQDLQSFINQKEDPALTTFVILNPSQKDDHNNAFHVDIPKLLTTLKNKYGEKNVILTTTDQFTTLADFKNKIDKIIRARIVSPHNKGKLPHTVRMIIRVHGSPYGDSQMGNKVVPPKDFEILANATQKAKKMDEEFSETYGKSLSGHLTLTIESCFSGKKFDSQPNSIPNLFLSSSYDTAVTNQTFRFIEGYEKKKDNKYNGDYNQDDKRHLQGSMAIQYHKKLLKIHAHRIYGGPLKKDSSFLRQTIPICLL